jgi:hypothetical protein
MNYSAWRNAKLKLIRAKMREGFSPSGASCAAIFRNKAYALEFFEKRFGSNPPIIQ